MTDSSRAYVFITERGGPVTTDNVLKARVHLPLSPLSKSGILRPGMSTSLRMKRVWLRRISALAAMALLFAQVSVAAYACPDLGDGPAAAASMLAEQGRQPDAGHDAQHRSLCHEHCKAQPSVDHVQVVGVPPALPSGLVLSVADAHRPLLRVTYAEPDPARVNGPPCSILFCVFRN